MKITSINTYDAPLPAGHYSQGAVAGNVIFVSGQLPVVPLAGDNDSRRYQRVRHFRLLIMS